MTTKKKSAKNGRAKTTYNIEWYVKVQVRSKKNQIAFSKSYFGSQYVNKEEI